ncbi:MULTISPECIES: alpha/beta hydrolase [Actinosynnema]|uniref:alpha/beta hydrolase n=1 Tax=Actinosynnema TaxID=40566 RepID=UPI0020A5EC3C|nr:lysophospholipase [Actinosynnema pretiosum]MCP2094578.1 Lysophospholipase, alpha-beta hydrolase superfamily [Actinosynnema pretiosum]
MTTSYDNPAHLGPRGTVVVLPGRGESAAVYERLGLRLASDAYRVRITSDPALDPAGVAAEVKSLLADEADAPRPHVLLGSDTGALFAAVLLAEGAVAADGAVLAGLPTGRAGAAPADWEAELDARTTCPAHRARISDESAVRRGLLGAEPPADWVERAAPEDVVAPVLGLRGADDPLTAPDASRAWFSRLPDGELVGIAGTAHDALNNQTHRTAAALVVRFLERLRLGADLPEAEVVEVARPAR